ncbi:MAG: hypothetical protein VZQ98_14460 [Bacteroidales bacterium]|nr:hypothetical protein [Bacteroidales bacterium]
MKRKVEKKKYQIRKSRNGQKKKKKRQGYIGYLRRRDDGSSVYHRTKNREKIEVPVAFSLIDNPNETAEFFEKLFFDIQNASSYTLFDIRSENVKRVTVDALIYLMAIIQNNRKNRIKQLVFRCNFPQDENARKTYKECGIVDYSNSRLPSLNNKDIKKIITSKQNDPNKASEICDFVQEKFGCSKKKTQSLYTTIIELMSNVQLHAYISGNYDEKSVMYKRWYGYAEYRDNFIRVIFLDTGLGIPATVKKKFNERIKGLFGDNGQDADLISSALKGEWRTRTGDTYRGNGLPMVNDFLSSNCVDNYYIFSGKGGLLHSHEMNNKLENAYELRGTLIGFDLIKEGF